MPQSSARSHLKQIDFLVLAALDPAPLHGYGVVQAVEEVSEGGVRLRPGDVYRVLYRLERQQLIAPSEPPDAEADARRSYYRITDRGRRAARSHAALLAGVTERLLAEPGAGDR